MKKETLFLKFALFCIAIPVIALCIFVFPVIVEDAPKGSQKMAIVLYGIMAAMYISVIPFFLALLQTYRLLGYIDKNQAFSDLSVQALKKIKLYALSICGVFAISLPLFYIVGEVDDAPGVIIISLVLIFAPTVIAVFAAVLEKLLKNAIEMKIEHDLTI